MFLYQRTGRDGEWARLVAAVTPDFTDPATEGPLPGRENQWSMITGYRVRLALKARDWSTAITLQNTRTVWNRDRAAAALAAPGTSLTDHQRNRVRSLSASLSELGNILLAQEDPGCLPHFQEASTLAQHIGDRAAEAQAAGALGSAYLHVADLLDLDQAEFWFRRSLTLRSDSDRLGRAMNLTSLGSVALARFDEARAAGKGEAVLLEHLNAALDAFQQSLDLIPPDDHEQRGIIENQIGNTYHKGGDTRQALRHYQQSLKHEEARGNTYGAGRVRYNIALILMIDGQIRDALHYAGAALENFRRAGPGAASEAADAGRLIADLEQHRR
jgi:tetratricopeptide (TPR) repeat protein